MATSIVSVSAGEITDGQAAAMADADRLIASFLSGRNVNTADAYRRDFDCFLSFLEQAHGHMTQAQGAIYLLGKNNGHANATAADYKAYLIEAGLSPATINRRLSTLKSLSKTARLFGLINYRLELPGVESKSYRDTRGCGADGYRNMLGAIDTATPKGKRDAAILHLLFDCGLRRGEVAKLTMADIEADTNRVWILGKRRTQKEAITLPAPTAQALTAWIEARGDQPGAVFISMAHNATGQATGLSGTSVYRIVRDIGRRVNIETRPHGLRHAAITAALDLTSGDLRKCARFSRHKDIRVLNIYDDNSADMAGEVAAMVAMA